MYPQMSQRSNNTSANICREYCRLVQYKGCKLPPKSHQRRVLLASVDSSYSSKTLKVDFGLGDRTIVASRKRFQCLQDGRVLEPDIRRLASYNKLAVQRAVRFVLNESNMHRISWGTKTVLLDGRTVEFPKLV